MSPTAETPRGRRAATLHPDQNVVYVDMDNTLCDYWAAYERIQADRPDLPYPQSLIGFYRNLEPMPGAVEAFAWLSRQPELAVYILTAPSVINAHSYTEKREWVAKHLGMDACYRLILCPQKGLLQGDILIDDNTAGKGQEHFSGQVIQYRSLHYLNWPTLAYSLYRRLNLREVPPGEPIPCLDPAVDRHGDDED